MRNLCLGLIAFLILVGSGTGSLAADRVQFGTPGKEFPGFYLPMLAAEEKGFWKQNGLEVDWVPIRTGADLVRAVASRALRIGMVGSATVIPAAAAGVPAVIISNLYERSDFYLWVRADSPFKELKDLKGARIGVFGLGTGPHAYARAITKAAGLEKDVRFVGSGAAPETVAALRAGAVDGVVMTVFQLITLKLAGQVRELAAVKDYIPKEWTDQIVFAHKELIQSHPDAIKRTVKAVVQANQFVLATPSWTIGKLKLMSGYSDEAARLMYQQLALTNTGALERKAVENVRNFLIDYGIVSREKVPPVDELYTSNFTE